MLRSDQQGTPYIRLVPRVQSLFLSNRSQLATASLLLGVGILYLNSFPAAFHFDDYALILQNPMVTEDFPYRAFLEQYGGRPLTLWTFRWNYLISGPSPWAFHLVSVLLHTLGVILLFHLIRNQFQNPGMAFVTALIFGFHPLQTQAVNYIWARSVILMGCFVLGALLLAPQRPRLSILCFQLALWSRVDSIVLLPFLLALKPRYWKWWVGLALTNGLALTYSLFHYSPMEMFWNHSDAVGYWLLQPYLFWKALALFLWPAQLNLDHQILQPPVFVIVISVVGLAILAVLLRRLDSQRSALGTGLLWTLTFSLPTWAVPNPDPFNESRLYLPLAGLALMTAWLLSHDQSSRRSLNRSQWWGVLLLPILLIPQTLTRNQLWTNDLQLWQDTVKKSPGKARAHYNLGIAFLKNNQLKKAQESFQSALARNPEDDYSLAALGSLAELEKDWKRAKESYQKALNLNPENEYARAGLQRLGQKKLDQKAIPTHETAHERYKSP